MKIIQIKNVKIGEGIPKICVSLVGKNQEEISEETGVSQNSENNDQTGRSGFGQLYPFFKSLIVSITVGP